MKGIFYNSTEAVCSIWESGKMCYNALQKSDKYTLDYSEEKTLIGAEKYDFLVYNSHIAVNNWLTKQLLQSFSQNGVKKPNFAIITEIFLNGENPIQNEPANFFDHYIILDPTIQETNYLHGFARPIEDFELEIESESTSIPTEIPEVFSFGFATFGKEWHRIVEIVQEEYDIANIHFNIPKGTYIPDDMHQSLLTEIENNIQRIHYKPGIHVKITQEVFSKKELIEICARKTINCFYYNRSHIFSCGLSAVTDQAISAGRPILVTGDPTFRHLHSYINHYPKIGIKEAIEKTREGVLKMKKEWSAFHFMKKFETLLFSIIT